MSDKLKGIRAVCFDFNNTLVDMTVVTRKSNQEVVREAVALLGDGGEPSRYNAMLDKASDAADKEIQENYYSSLPISEVDSQESAEIAIRSFGRHLIELLGGRADEAAVERIYRAQLRGVAEADALFPDAMETLNILKKRYLLGIISDNMAEHVTGPMKHLGLEHFFDVVIVSGAEGKGVIKGNLESPEIFRRALEQLKVEPGQAVMVGDSLREDVGGARRAGMVTVWIDRSAERAGTVHEEKPDYTIRSLSELPRILGQLA